MRTSENWFKQIIPNKEHYKINPESGRRRRFRFYLPKIVSICIYFFSDKEIEEEMKQKTNLVIYATTTRDASIVETSWTASWRWTVLSFVQSYIEQWSVIFRDQQIYYFIVLDKRMKNMNI